MPSTRSTEEGDPPGRGCVTDVGFGGASEQPAWREARRMNEAVFAPVRVPAGRQGGPRTHCAAGWSQATAYRKTQITTQGARAGRRVGPSRARSAESCGRGLRP